MRDQSVESHPKLIEHALEMGWTKTAEEFNFARDYGDYWRAESKSPGSMQIRRNQTLACLRKDQLRISPASMMRINRTHHEGTIVAPRWGAAEPFWATPCMHDSPRSRYRTAASMVAHLRDEMPPLLRQVYWASFSNPCCGVFKPFYLHGVKVPKDHETGCSVYNRMSRWWQANRVKLLCDLNYRALNPTVRGIFDQTEQWERERQRTFEARAAKLIEQGQKADAVELLQRFVDENCARVEKECQMLNQTLPAMLHTVGVEYVYADYLKDWSSKQGVPLPLPPEEGDDR